jgi:hypothetical protein
LGAVITAAIIYLIRHKDRKMQTVAVDGSQFSYDVGTNERTIEGIGLYLKPEPLSDLAGIQNLSNQVGLLVSGKFKIKGSTLDG